MSKKQLNSGVVLNELKGGSVFFQKDHERSDDRSEERPQIRTENRSDQRTVRLPIKRRTKRYSFEFYEDQITRIKKIKIETELDGESISLSEIVRQALDHYFDSVRETERSEERTQLRSEKRTEERPEKRLA